MLKTLLLLGALTLAAAFQNCSPLTFFGSSATSTSTSSGGSGSNGGHPYDGKTYVVYGLCSDGVQVESRIVVTSDTSALLVRQTCETLSAPVQLVSADFNIDREKGVLYYRGVTYVGEMPPTPLPVSKPFYYQNAGTQLTLSNTFYVTPDFRLTPVSVSAMKAAGNTVICELGAGTISDDSPELSRLLPADLGNTLPKATFLRWLDIRSPRVRAVVADWIAQAAQVGCEGVMFVNVDGYAHSSGFPLTEDEQVAFNRSLAFAAKDRRLFAGHFNVSALASRVADVFDFAAGGSCFRNGTCSEYVPWVTNGRPVFLVEFTPMVVSQCQQAKSLAMQLTFLNMPMDGTRNEPCP